MNLSGRRAVGAAAAAVLLAACGDPSGPEPGADGRVEATPRALASVLVDHVGGEPRRATGHWSEWSDPLEVEAQVDYGEDPEGGGQGPTRTFRITAVDKAAYSPQQLARWFHCAKREPAGGCEEETVDGATVLYRWYTGVEEEEPGSFGWTVVRDDEIVTVRYEPSGYYTKDPRDGDLWFAAGDLRAAALDPAMSLRTTTEAYDAGQALGDYEGVEQRPEKPDVVPTTTQQLADRLLEYIGGKPSRITRSKLDDFGPDAVGAHLEFPARSKFDGYEVDVLTTVGRPPIVDPLPCEASEEIIEDPAITCYGFSHDSVETWTLAQGGQPGVIWYLGYQDDDKFNRIESVGVRIESDAIDASPLMSDTRLRLPDGVFNAGPFISDLRVGPETRLAD